MSRLEANKDVRRILNRNGVDLSYTQYSVAGMDIRLTGWLCKYDGSDFSTVQVENLIQEFQRTLHGYTVSGDFENWSFTTDHISKIGNDHEHEEAQVYYEDYESEAS